MDNNNILVVDDNIDLAEGLVMVLEDEGLNATAVYNGFEALNLLNMHKFDLVLLDAKLPDKNGLEINRMIQKENLAKHVIIMTGFRIEQFISDAMPDIKLQILNQLPSLENIPDLLTKYSNKSLTIIEEVDPTFLSNFTNDHQLIHKIQHKNDTSSISEDDKGMIFIQTGGTVLEMLDLYFELKIQNITLPTFIILTKSKTSSAIDTLKSFEITGCLFKPFDLEMTMEIIKNIVYR